MAILEILQSSFNWLPVIDMVVKTTLLLACAALLTTGARHPGQVALRGRGTGRLLAHLLGQGLCLLRARARLQGARASSRGAVHQRVEGQGSVT